MTYRKGGAGSLVAVVVTHNRRAHLQLTLSRLLASPANLLAAVIVVDNTSSDGTSEWLSEQTDPRLEVRRSDKNLGGAGGFEWGMREAMACFDPDWLLLMDDDARPEEGALEVFHAVDRSSHDAWAAAVRHPDGRICDINRPTINPFWDRAAFLRTLSGAGRNGFHLNPEDYASVSPRDVDAASFVGLFVSADAVRRVGYPDGRLFVYGDDVLYTLGLRGAGGRIAFDPTLRFEHDFSTLAAGERRFRPLWKSYYHHRNLLIVYRTAARGMFWPALVLIIPKWLAKARDHQGEVRPFLGLMLRAIRDGLLSRTDIPHDRVIGWVGKEVFPPEPTVRSGTATQ